MSSLVPLEKVQAEILAAVPNLSATEVALTDALGLVLAEDIFTAEPIPPFANTAMDGYAVRAVDTESASLASPVSLRVVDEVPAGHVATQTVGPSEAIRIMTGAPMPNGADAVVMVERTHSLDPETVAVEHPATRGDHVRLAGGDLAAGDEVFSLGTELTAAHIGVLASIGVTQIRVIPAPRVGVLSTGDELIAAGPLVPGQIRDSNRPMLLGLVRESGFVPVDLGQVGDDEDLIVDTLRPALLECDAILTSGGVSVGDYDFVKAALNRLGSLEWRQVAIKPAKPLAFGVISGTPIFGLPGNPVSSLVSYELFARPALRQMSGHPILHRPTVSARAEHDFTRRPDGKVHFVRVQVRWSESGYVVASSGEQASNVLSATARANGLARIPDGNGVTAGDSVSVVLWRA